MDHKVRLEPNYTKPTIDELFREYQKAIPELTIDDSVKKQIELDKIKKRNTELEKTHVAKDQVREMIEDTVRTEIEKLIHKADE